MCVYPRIFRVRQKFDDPHLDDIAGAVENELTRLRLSNVILAGQSVAISAGSRGITNSNFVNNGYVFLFENDRLPRVCPGKVDPTKNYVFHPTHTIFGEEI